MVYKVLLGVIVILSILSTFVLIYFAKRGNNLMQIVLSVTLLFSNIGYFELSMSTGLNEALLANTLAYIGGIFLPMIVMFILADFSKSKLPKWFVYFILVINVILFFAVMFAGKVPLYYKSIRFVYDGDFARLKKTGGFLYYIRIVVLGVEMVLSVFFTVLTYIGRKTASFKTMLLYASTLLFGVIAYIIEKITNLDYDIVPFFYIGCSLVLIYITTRSMLYDVNLSVQEKIDELSNYAYIVFDGKLNYAGSNAAAVKYFPELKDARIDFPLKIDNYAVKNLINWIKENSKPEDVLQRSTKSIIINDRDPEKRRFLECELSYIHFGINRRVMGYLIEMEDITQQHDMIEQLKFSDSRSQREVSRQTAKVKNLQESTILGMASMIESRDNSTGGHINRTSACASLFVDHLKTLPEFNMSESYWYAVKQAAVLHDLGKIAVDDAILRKTTGLTDEEYEKMKIHATVGSDIVHKVLKDVDDKEFIKVAANVAHYHHEKYNGTGYPDHLRGEKIPLEARIMAIVDVFDALASKRSYKEQMPYDQCFEIIKKDIGTHFDPMLGRVFLSMKDDIVALYETFEGTDKAR